MVDAFQGDVSIGLVVFLLQMVTIVDPHIKRDDDYHIHRVRFLFIMYGFLR